MVNNVPFSLYRVSVQKFLRNRNIQEQPTNQDKPKMLLLAGTCILNVSNIEICYILKILLFFFVMVRFYSTYQTLENSYDCNISLSIFRSHIAREGSKEAYVEQL